MLVTSDMYKLINYVGFANWVWYGVAIGGLVYWRFKYPTMKRPIKVCIKMWKKFVPIFFFFFFLKSIFLLESKASKLLYSFKKLKFLVRFSVTSFT